MTAKLTDNARTILGKRYLQPGETPEGMFSRVSGGVKEYEQLMSDLLFLPNSPTLFNMGTKTGGTLSACFVFDIADTLYGDVPGVLQSDSILGTTFKAASVAKAGGGVGYYLGNIREEGAVVNSTHKRACGPVQVLHWKHRLRNLITQGGKRDLAQMAILPCWHPDVFKFVHCKDEDPKALESFNISVSWTDEWLEKVDFNAIAGGIGFDPEQAPNVETRLWIEQCLSAWRTGDPGMFFWSTTNRAHPTPHVGAINATNPCGETPNTSNEPCNLGSLALLRFVLDAGKKTARVAWSELKAAVHVAIRFLDDILDWNTFPHPDIDKTARHTRKLGLGVMGWADMLAILRIPYDSQEAVDLAGSIMSWINDAALGESMRLADVKGPYPAWQPSVSPEWAPRARNSTRTSIAPTGTISIIAGCEPSIEPHYALERTRTTNEGIKMTERVEDWLGDLGGFVPKVANEIDWRWHVRHQAAFQKHVDLGVSKTVNLPNSATVDDVSGAYRMMHQLGCKGGTIYRDGCRAEQVLVSSKKTSVYAVGEVKTDEPKRKRLPKDCNSHRHKFRVGGTEGYLHVGLWEDGAPGEVFIRSSLGGSTLNGMIDAWAMTFSNALQHGTPLKDLVRLHMGQRFEPAGLTGNPDIPTCTSIPDYVVRYLSRRYLGETQDQDSITITVTTKEVIDERGKAKAAKRKEEPEVRSGQLCPDCGSELILRAGCLCCLKAGCGFSRCG